MTAFRIGEIKKLIDCADKNIDSRDFQEATALALIVIAKLKYLEVTKKISGA